MNPVNTKTTKGIVASVLAALVLMLAPQPVAAAPSTALPAGEVVCFLEFRHGILVGERCIAFRPIWPDCVKCDAIAIDYGTDIFVHDRFVDGFVQLDKAAHAVDPASAAAYRKAALDRFMTVAKVTRGEIVRDVGYVDRKSGGFTSEPRQWLVAARSDIEAGLGLLRLAMIDPDGDPALVAQGMRYLDQAYQHLANGR